MDAAQCNSVSGPRFIGRRPRSQSWAECLSARRCATLPALRRRAARAAAVRDNKEQRRRQKIDHEPDDNREPAVAQCLDPPKPQTPVEETHETTRTTTYPHSMVPVKAQRRAASAARACASARESSESILGRYEGDCESGNDGRDRGGRRCAIDGRAGLRPARARGGLEPDFAAVSGAAVYRRLSARRGVLSNRGVCGVGRRPLYNPRPGEHRLTMACSRFAAG